MFKLFLTKNHIIMKKSIRKKITISSILVAVISGLSIAAYLYYLDLSAYTTGIDQPFEKTIPFVTEKFNADSVLVIHTPNGTHVEVPSNAFLDPSGKPVIGEAQFKFREFHDANAIMLSGIPMQMKNNRSQFMQSSGMIELRAFQNGRELSLAEGKKINVDLASLKKPTEDYRLYFLENDEEWKESGEYNTINNNRRDSALVNLPDCPIEPFNPEPDSTDFVFQLSPNFKSLPYLKPFKGVDWKLLVDEVEEIPYWALRLNWDRIKLKEIDKKKNIYSIELSWSKNKSNGGNAREKCKLKAIPLLSGKELKKAKKQYAQEFKKYEELVALQEKEEERLMKEQALLNSFTINQMGIFNIDVINNMELFAKIELEFDFEDEYSPEFNKVVLIMVFEDLNTVLKLNAFEWDQIPVTNNSTELIAVLPNGDVARVDPISFSKKVNQETVSEHFTNKFYFNTERIEADEYAKMKANKMIASPMF